MRVQAVAQAQARFTRRELRERTGWGDTQLRVHLERLVSLEYLLAHREGAGGRFTYELVFDGDVAAAAHLSGLIDATGLEAVSTMAKSRGAEPEVAGRLRVDRGPVAAPLRAGPSAAVQALVRLGADCPDEDEQTHVLRANGKNPSYVAPSPSTGLRTGLAAEDRQ
jgi:DNA primase